MKQESTQKLDLVQVRSGQPFTTTLEIAKGCQLTHQGVIKLVRKYRADFDEFETLRFEISKSGGTPIEFALLNEDQATYLVTLFRNNEVVRHFKKALVKAFRKAINEIDRLRKQKSDPIWKLVRDETRVGFKWMNEALKERRDLAGKITKSHHYQNEARLVNFVLTGEYQAVHRDGLSAIDLELLTRLQRKNAALIDADTPYRERKEILMDIAISRLSVSE